MTAPSPSTGNASAAQSALERLAAALDHRDFATTLVTSRGTAPYLAVTSRHAPASEVCGVTGEERLWRMRSIAAELSLAGLDTHIHESSASIDVTATLRGSGQRETEAIIDDDGYVELHFWTNPAASPADLRALITNALTAITSPPPEAAGPAGPGQGHN